MTTLAALALTGCSDGTSGPRGTSPAASAPRRGSDAVRAAPLSSAALNQRLLTEQDLGEGYVRKAEPAQHDEDVSVIGCPALDQLGGEAATGQGLDFPRKAKAAFTYDAGTTFEVSEEIYSDTAQKLSDGVGHIFDAMTYCPKYQVVSGSTVIDMTTQEMAAPRLGEERWSQLLTYSVGGQRSTVKQTAVRTKTVIVVVAGSPALVDAHIRKAVTKATAARRTG
nr:hypothetical protein [Streptomyces typhae]